MLGGGPAPGRGPQRRPPRLAPGARSAAWDLRPSRPQARRRRRPVARLSALALGLPTLPPRGDKRRIQPGHSAAAEGEAERTPAQPPPTQRDSPAQVAASARTSPPRARALTHLQVSVRLSIGTRAAGVRGGPAGAGQPGRDGAGRGGGRERGRRAEECRQVERERRRAAGGRRCGAGGGGRQPGSPTSARRSVRPGLLAPGSERGWRTGGRGAGRGRGGAGERGGGSDPGLQPAPETRRGPRDPQEVCNDTSYDAHRARSCRCPRGVWTDPPTTYARARAGSPHPDRCGTHDLQYGLSWAAPTPALRHGPRSPLEFHTAPPKC